MCSECHGKFWLVVGVNSRTGKREVLMESISRETALCHKIDLERETPRRYCGVTVEYGRRHEWEQDQLRPLHLAPTVERVMANQSALIDTLIDSMEEVRTLIAGYVDTKDSPLSALDRVPNDAMRADQLLEVVIAKARRARKVGAQ